MTVNTIALAKPEKAKMVESMLIQMAQTGQIQGKVMEWLLWYAYALFFHFVVIY